MTIKLKQNGRRVLNLIMAVREISAILPGDKVRLVGEKPATYEGAIEVGDIQEDDIQMHAFRLFDGLQVILEVPSLNRCLGKLLY